MVDIPINAKYRIGADKKQWILYEKMRNTWRPVMFFSRLENLTLELLELTLKASLARDISDLREDLKRFRSWLLASHFSQHFQDYQKTASPGTFTPQNSRKGQAESSYIVSSPRLNKTAPAPKSEIGGDDINANG